MGETARSAKLRPTMKLSRRQSTVLLVMGLIMLIFWLTRSYTWYANDLQANPYLAWVHFPIIIISLAIGIYLTYLGVRGRRASSSS